MTRLTPEMSLRIGLLLVALLSALVTSLPISAETRVEFLVIRKVHVYRIWESMKEPPNVQVEVTNGMDMKDFVDEVKKILKENDDIVIRTRAGLVVIDVDEAPEKVFVLVGEESYFYPADTIGEKFQVPLRSMGDKVVEVEVLSNSPRLVLIKNFLTDEECDEIIEEAKPQMKRSTTVQVGDQSSGGTEEEADIRTSSTAWMMNRQLPIVKTVDSKVQDLTTVDMSWAENMQVLHYGHKQHYYVHHDFFDPKVYLDDDRWGSGHNRMLTVFFYLTTVEEGGQTIFPYGQMPKDRWHTVKNSGNCDEHMDALLVPAVKGSAIIFYHVPAANQTPSTVELDTTSLHGGCDPIRGDKWAANYWVRNGILRFPAKENIKKRIDEQQERYGIDKSWPAHHRALSDILPNIFFDVDKRYMAHMEACRLHAAKMGGRGSECDESERRRLAANLEGPATSASNFTARGHFVTRLPSAVWQSLRHVLSADEGLLLEQLGKGAPHAADPAFNSWESAVTRVPLASVMHADTRHADGLMAALESRVKGLVQWWTGRVARVLGEAELHVHAKRGIVAPRVGSPMKGAPNGAHVCVVIQVSEPSSRLLSPWPIELYAHDGWAVNASLKGGEMLMYECQSVISGRPFVLEGEDSSKAVHLALELSGAASPLYHPYGHGTEGSSKLHVAAAMGRLEEVKELMTEAEGVGETRHFAAADVNDWQPLHEAARGGHLEIVKLLIQKGVDVNARTNGGGGSTAHSLAKQSLDPGHELIKFFEEVGAEL